MNPTYVKFLSLTEMAYIIYMFFFFKTKYSIHHPFEYKIVNFDEILKHPINTGKYESKICPFGKIIVWFLILFLFIRTFFLSGIYRIYSKIVLLITFILSLSNFNVIIYLLPYYVIELIMLMC